MELFFQLELFEQVIIAMALIGGFIAFWGLIINAILVAYIVGCK